MPDKIHTVLTDNGILFRSPPRGGNGPTAQAMTRLCNMRRRENGIEHRLAKINHLWTKTVL